MNYIEFLNKKKKHVIGSGFDIDEKELNKNLFPFQKWIVKQALKKGKYALFENCGLGKTIQQLEWANQVSIKTNGVVLILAPLAVSGQTISQGEKFGIEVKKYSEFGNDCKLLITNYEQLKNINTEQFIGVVLDESSILKNFTGSYKNMIIDKFKNTPYKLACTATPSPNDDMELCNHAEFLDVMGRNEMLAMYFTHDGGETAKWRLKGHAYKKFFEMVSEWSVFVNDPSDIGFESQGYMLPPLNFFERQIQTSSNAFSLFNEVSVSATNFNQQLRITLVDRMESAAEIVNSSNENFIIWVNQDEEEKHVNKLIDTSIVVSGKMKDTDKEEKLLGFARNDFRVLITKKKIAQFGLNFQNCNNQIFASLDFSFEGLYQAIRRSYRFGQTKPVNIYIITTDSMQNVIDIIKRKQDQFDRLKKTFKNIYDGKLRAA